MRRNTLNFWLDLSAFVLMLALAATGLLMGYVLPPGSGSKTLWGLGRHAWGDVHFWMAATLVTLIAVHLALHWRWTTGTIRRLVPWRRGRVTPGRRDGVWGMLTLAVVAAALGAFVVVGRSQVVTPDGGADDHEEPAARTGVPTY